MGDCIFCKIAAGEIKAQIIRENDDIVAFKDLNPQAPTHILIIPKKHIQALSMSSDEDALLLGKIQLFARDLAKELGLSGGFRLVTNNGRAVGQSVDHLHYHMLAGRRMLWPPG